MFKQVDAGDAKLGMFLLRFACEGKVESCKGLDQSEIPTHLLLSTT
jgi:hypothetical protein